jgi:paraquat-inducible protein B
VSEHQEFIQMRSLILELQQKESEYKSRIESLEKSLNAFPEVPSVEELERHVTLIEQQLERKEKEATALEHYLSTRDEEYTVAKLDLDTLKEENDRLKLELNESLSRQRDTFQSLEQLQNVRQELVAALELNKKLTEDLNRERVLRKKYFNCKTFKNHSEMH